MKKLKFSGFATLLLSSASILLSSCSDESESFPKSVVSDDDPISVVLHKYLNTHSSTRTDVSKVTITNIERRVYSLMKGRIKEKGNLNTRTPELEFDVVRADFCTNGKKGFAYLTTHPDAKGVYYYTDNAEISDTTINKPLSIMLSAVPDAVGEVINGGFTPSYPTIPDSIGQIGSGPLLKTNWDQIYPYNMKCPDASSKSPDLDKYNKRCPAGCVAIATAQTIAYCKRFTSTFYGSKDLNFNNLPASAINESNRIQLQIATFIHEVGVNVNTKYTDSESGTKLKCVLHYLRELGYTCEYEKGNFNQSKLASTIMGSVLSGNKKSPVIVGGYSSDGKGHAWVIDGVRTTNSNIREFHMNWGFGGEGNGWAASPLLTKLTTINSSRDYLKENDAIYITNY